MKKDKDLIRIKRKILKQYPNAKCFKRINNTYEICDGSGYKILNNDINLPPADTVRQAWMNFGYCLWYNGMIQKSFRAFSDEKMSKKLEKEIVDDE